MSLRSLLALFALAIWPIIGDAEHANINLSVLSIDLESGKSVDKATAVADQEPPAGGINPRTLFKAKVNEPLVLQFFLTNTYPHGELRDVTVRFFVVREEKVRQKTVPALTEGVVTQGRFKLNLKPKCRVGARVAFTIKDPGIYLLRVHTVSTKSDHEHFSAIDLQVE